jgi:HEAT repeat protein
MDCRCLLVLVAVLVAGEGYVCGQAAEPEKPFRGKTFSEWRALLQHPEPKMRSRAATALGLGPFGKQAIAPLMQALPDSNPHVRQSILIALRDIGPRAPDEVPLLAETIAKHWEGADVLQALRALGPGAVPALLEKGKGGSWWEIRPHIASMGPAALPPLVEALNNPAMEMRRLSAVMMGGLGSEAVPSLIQALGDRTWDVRSAALESLADIGPRALPARPALLPLLAHKDAFVRDSALKALASIDLAFAIPLIIERSPEEFAVRCLLQRGPQGVKAVRERFATLERRWRRVLLELDRVTAADALPLLLDGLADPEASIRRVAASKLACSEADLAPVLGRLASALAKEDGRSCEWILRAIARICPLPAEGLAILAGALRHRDYLVITEAADQLGRLGAAAFPVLPQILDCLRDPRDCVRRSALQVLGKVAPGDREVVRAVCRALHDDDQWIRCDAATLLGSLLRHPGEVDGGPAHFTEVRDELQADLVVEDLRGCLRDSTALVRVAAAASLFKLGQGDDELLDKVAWEIVAPFGNSDKRRDGVHLQPFSALRQLGPKAARVVPILTLALWDTNVWVPPEAIEVLRRIGPASRTAIPSLRRILRNNHTEDAAAALSALVAISEEGTAAIHEEISTKPDLVHLVTNSSFKPTPDAAVLVPYVVEALARGSEQERRSALVALERLKPRTGSACDALVGCLGDESEQIRKIACRVLCSMGAAGRPAVPALCEMLLERNAELRVQAIASLQKIGPDPRIALPALVESLTDPNEEVRCRAAEALGSMGEAGRSASAALCAALRDQEERVRLAAAVALGQVEQSKERAVRELVILMESGKGAVRVEAAGALGRLDRGHPVVPALVRMLEDRALVRAATETLLQLHGHADEVAAFVRPLLRHKDYFVRRSAQRILWNLPKR